MSESYKEDYEILKSTAQLLMDNESIDLDDLVPMLDKAAQAYQRCQDKIKAVEALMKEKFSQDNESNG